MKIKLHQIDLTRDEQRVAFEGLDRLQQFRGTRDIDRSLYDIVFDGDVEARDLEDVFARFNSRTLMPDGYTGRSMSVSDVVETGGELYYCDTVGFEPVRWEQSEKGT